MKPCAKCGDLYEPVWLPALKSWSRVCHRCAVLNLASLLEDHDADDSISDISEGEQIGAWLREKAGR